MTKEQKERREVMAAFVLGQIVIRGHSPDTLARPGSDGMFMTLARATAVDALAYADALIAELDKEPTDG